jgi:hypothetical protein
MAITESPMNLSIVPPVARIAVVMASRYRPSACASSAGGRRSDSSVNPRMSVNINVSRASVPPSAGSRFDA